MTGVSQPQSGSIGSLSCRPEPDNKLVPMTLEFIRSQIPGWRDDTRRAKDSAEPDRNSSLCDFLDIQSRNIFPMVRFKHQAPQGRTRSIDIGVQSMDECTYIGAGEYSKYEPFMVIEAKRLPAPSSAREREYVSGTYPKSGNPAGGIQRLKLGLHGANIETAVMVGYIEQESAQHWHININIWINDLVVVQCDDGCTWTENDKLIELYCNNDTGVSQTESNHERTNLCITNNIRIHHYWVLMRFE